MARKRKVRAAKSVRDAKAKKAKADPAWFLRLQRTVVFKTRIEVILKAWPTTGADWCRPRRSHKLHRFGTYIGDGKWSACRQHGIAATEGQPRVSDPVEIAMCRACLRRSPDDLKRIR